MGAVILSFFAGTLSVLSPCVLPLLPIVVASALHEHRHGPLALGTGLVVSSALMGLFFASLGFPVLLIAYGSRHHALRSGARLSGLAALGKPVMGGLLLIVGVLALTGADKTVETWMVDRMPTWLLELTTAL